MPTALTPAMRRSRLIRLGAFAALVFAGIHALPRLAQDVRYHGFADTRTMAGIPNFNDVVSNAPFVLVGIAGLLALRKRGPARVRNGAERAAWAAAFAGVLLTGFGSAYYHWRPVNETLGFDRLPMTVCFSALMATQFAECVGEAAGRRLLLPLLGFGAGSVGYWAWTESAGVGDLRWYGYVQFFPALLIPILWRSFPRTYDRIGDFAYAGLWYAAAKLLEAGDRAVFDLTRGFVSGHTLKHAAAAVATLCFVRHLVRRRPTDPVPDLVKAPSDAVRREGPAA